MSPPHVLLDLERNTLAFPLRDDQARPVSWLTVPAFVDIGEAGRLLALEVDLSGSCVLSAARPWQVSNHIELDSDSRSLSVTLDAGHEPHARSSPAEGRLGLDRDGMPVLVEVPRRGAGYEITYPSGNQ